MNVMLRRAHNVTRCLLPHRLVQRAQSPLCVPTTLFAVSCIPKLETPRSIFVPPSCATRPKLLLSPREQSRTILVVLGCVRVSKAPGRGWRAALYVVQLVSVGGCGGLWPLIW